MKVHWNKEQGAKNKDIEQKAVINDTRSQIYLSHISPSQIQLNKEQGAKNKDVEQKAVRQRLKQLLVVSC